MMAMMNPKLMISSAHPPAPVRAWAGGAVEIAGIETVISKHTVLQGRVGR